LNEKTLVKEAHDIETILNKGGIPTPAKTDVLAEEVARVLDVIARSCKF
jgi:hypothetical protein